MQLPPLIKFKSGFTLLEALVAFAILSISFVALFQAFGGGISSITKAQSVDRLVLQARSKLAEVGATIDLAPGEVEGLTETGGTWQVAITPVESLDSVGAAQRQLQALNVVVTMNDRDGNEIELRTLRLGETR